MYRSITLPILLIFTYCCLAQYQPLNHRKITGKEIAVRSPGSFAEPGNIYVLVNDISSETSPIFLGKDVILDLNGYTIKFADAK